MADDRDGAAERPREVAALLDYQEGAIVSRVILKREVGSVTLFAFDRGQELSEHTAPFDALVHVVEGDAEITISGERHSVRGGEMIVMPANRPHAAANQMGPYTQSALHTRTMVPCRGLRPVGRPIGALGFASTSPMILAHGGLATTDLAFAATLTLVLFLFLRYATTPGRMVAAATGVAFALPLLTKLSALLFLPARQSL